MAVGVTIAADLTASVVFVGARISGDMVVEEVTIVLATAIETVASAAIATVDLRARHLKAAYRFVARLLTAAAAEEVAVERLPDMWA